MEGRSLASGSRFALAESVPSWPVFAEVSVALSELRERGWRIAILSNTDPDLLAASVAVVRRCGGGARRRVSPGQATARPARSRISGTLSSQATAITWQPATPSVSRSRSITSTQMRLPSSPSSEACSMR